MADSYLAIKALHIAAAACSVALFGLRGVWMIVRPDLLRRRAVRVVPHVVDTVLLASAIALVIRNGTIPPQSWLVAKLAALVVYIVLGSIALKRGRTRPIRIASGLAALATFGYIVSVALTHSPAGFLGGS